jgi:hypothetical protein
MRRADNLTTFVCRLSWNLGASTFWNTQSLSRPVTGLLYLNLTLYTVQSLWYGVLINYYEFNNIFMTSGISVCTINTNFLYILKDSKPHIFSCEAVLRCFILKQPHLSTSKKIIVHPCWFLLPSGVLWLLWGSRGVECHDSTLLASDAV